MKSDPLLSVVKSFDLSGAVFLNAEFSAPWAITSHVTEEDCRPYMPVPRRVIAFHVIIEGEFILSMDSTPGYRQDHRVKPGDIVFLPQNSLHVLASSLGQIPLSGDDLLLPAGDSGLVQINHQGGGAPAHFMCGFLASNAGSIPMLEALPDVLVISIESLATRKWIEASVMMAARELTQGQFGGGGTMPGLCELLLSEALRSYIEQNPKPPGWLGGMAHPRVSRALARIHSQISDPPSIEALASEAGMSRSAFVDKFTEVMQAGPRRYLLDRRMELAEALLSENYLNVAQIATQVGYDAPEAFSRAFKRERGMSPAEWRAHLSRK